MTLKNYKELRKKNLSKPQLVKELHQLQLKRKEGKIDDISYQLLVDQLLIKISLQESRDIQEIIEQKIEMFWLKADYLANGNYAKYVHKHLPKLESKELFEDLSSLLRIVLHEILVTDTRGYFIRNFKFTKRVLSRIQELFVIPILSEGINFDEYYNEFIVLVDSSPTEISKNKNYLNFLLDLLFILPLFLILIQVKNYKLLNKVQVELFDLLRETRNKLNIDEISELINHKYNSGKSTSTKNIELKSAKENLIRRLVKARDSVYDEYQSNNIKIQITESIVIKSAGYARSTCRDMMNRFNIKFDKTTNKIVDLHSGVTY